MSLFLHVWVQPEDTVLGPLKTEAVQNVAVAHQLLQSQQSEPV